MEQLVLSDKWARKIYLSHPHTHDRLLYSFRYEKMISGLFLGEIVRLIINKLKDNGVLFMEHWPEDLEHPGRFYTKYVSEVLK